MAHKRLKAKTSRKRKPSGGGSSLDYTTPLVVAFFLFLLGGLTWYLWPRPGPPATAEKENQRKLKELTTQHPDAEVFELGDGEKKK